MCELPLERTSSGVAVESKKETENTDTTNQYENMKQVAFPLRVHRVIH